MEIDVKKDGKEKKVDVGDVDEVKVDGDWVKVDKPEQPEKEKMDEEPKVSPTDDKADGDKPEPEQPDEQPKAGITSRMTDEDRALIVKLLGEGKKLAAIVKETGLRRGQVNSYIYKVRKVRKDQKAQEGQ